MEKFEPKPEKNVKLDIDLEISPESLEKYKGFKEEIGSSLDFLGVELTEEEIEDGYVSENMVSFEPITFVGVDVQDFENPEEEAEAKKAALTFAFENLGVDLKNLKLIKEVPGK